jgi:hypothetical protein
VSVERASGLPIVVWTVVKVPASTVLVFRIPTIVQKIMTEMNDAVSEEEKMVDITELV